MPTAPERAAREAADAVSRAADDPVAQRVRALRLGLGWSLKRLSAETEGLAPSFLFNIENGRKVPSEEVAARIAHALGDSGHEEVYRAWARVKSRGRTGRIDHDAMLEAWEVLRRGFDGGKSAAETAPREREPSRDLGRLKIPVLASATDPGDSVRPPAERVVNTLSLDPSLYGHDALLARERFARLRRPFAFPIEPGQARRAHLPSGQLAVVTREALAAAPEPDTAYVVRCSGRLEVVRGEAVSNGAWPQSLRAAGIEDVKQLREAVVGRVAMVLPDVRL